MEYDGVVIFKTKRGVLGHIDVNFNIPDKASESKLELDLCKGTLEQEEMGTHSHLYSPQGDYIAVQNRTTEKPTEYTGKGNELYLKQLQDFCACVKTEKPNCFYADRAV